MRKLSRREFLIVGGSLAATATVAACSGQQTPAPTAAPAAVATAVPTLAPASKYREAPMLAELVKAGKLPPVDQRLPVNPLVVKPYEKIGQYGGTYRIGLRGSGDTAGLLRMLQYNNLLRWDPQFKTVIPDLAESVTASDDARTFTIKLRQGVKWSDGHPFTTDDIVFFLDCCVVRVNTANSGIGVDRTLKTKKTSLHFEPGRKTRCGAARPNNWFVSSSLRWNRNGR